MSGLDRDRYRLEGSRVLVDGVLPATRMTEGFPVKRFYQKVGPRFQIARQLPEVQGFQRRVATQK